MKKPNKKADKIKQKKSLKRAAERKRKAKQIQDGLNAKKNNVEKAKQQVFDQYLELVRKQFEEANKTDEIQASN